MHEGVAKQIKRAVNDVPTVGTIREFAVVPRLCGIYFFVFEHDIVYIGQSVDVVQRVNQHLDEDRKTFDRVLFMPCPVGLLDYYEKHLIAALEPRFNRSRKRTSAAEFTHSELQRRGGATFEEIVDSALKFGIWAQTKKSLEANIWRALHRNRRVTFDPDDGKYHYAAMPAATPKVQ